MGPLPLVDRPVASNQDLWSRRWQKGAELSMVRNHLVALLITTVCLASAVAVAEDERVYETAQAITGKAVQIGVFARANGVECKSGPLPDVKVVHAPEHGTLTLKRGTLKTDRFPKCPGLQVNAQVLFYQSRADFVGADDVAFVVSFDNGETQARQISINVTGPL
jgi:hypothetical protein